MSSRLCPTLCAILSLGVWAAYCTWAVLSSSIVAIYVLFAMSGPAPRANTNIAVSSDALRLQLQLRSFR